MAKTFVLVGYDESKSFTREVETLAAKDDVVIVHAKPGESVATTMKAAGIKAGDMVMIEAHGSVGADDKPNGKIVWNKGQNIPYSEIFKNIPEGVPFVTVASCYGGMAQNDLPALPPGTTLHSTVGETISLAWIGNQMSGELGKNFTQLDVVLEALDNVDPQKLAEWDKQYKITEKEGVARVDPNKVLPHTIGIGGKPPVELNLDKQIERLTKNHASLNTAAMSQAISLVQEKFDTRLGDTKRESAEAPELVAQKERQLDLKVAEVAAKIQSGIPLDGLQEKRIGYAITYTYLDKSGELEQMVNKAKGISQPAPEVAVSAPATVPATAAPTVATTIATPPPAAAPAPAPIPQAVAPISAPVTKAERLEALDPTPQPVAASPAPAAPKLEPSPIDNANLQKLDNLAQPAPAQQAPKPPKPEEIQRFLNEQGYRDAGGQELKVDNIVGPKTTHAYVAFCQDHGLDPAKGIDAKFQDTMRNLQSGTEFSQPIGKEFIAMKQAIETGALTKDEQQIIKNVDKVVDAANNWLPAGMQASLRDEFAEMRAKLRGGENTIPGQDPAAPTMRSNAPQPEAATAR